MRPLSASQLLDVWESGLPQQLPYRALTLLAAATPDTVVEELSQLSIGKRDARLLTLREWTFGSQLASLAICPHCGESLDLDFQVSDIRVARVEKATREFYVTADDCEVHCRLPNSLDLVDVAGNEDVQTVRRLLLQRCVLAARSGSEEQPVNELPEDVLTAVIARMSEADPQADVELALSCPLCSYEWQAAFDILAFFWSEIDAWAKRVLRDVHALATAYGWREDDILSMTALRRQLYLEMASL
jgi:hypothetical protein